MDSHTPFVLVVAFTSSLLNQYIICGNVVRYIDTGTYNESTIAAHIRPQAMEPAGCVVCPTDCTD